MTACKDVQDVTLGKKAVSAALAGTLAVGMVPAVALAAPADEAAADDGIESMILVDSASFAAGTVTGATVAGKAVADPSNIEIMLSQVIDGTGADAGKYTVPLIVTQVTPSVGTPVSLDATTTYQWQVATSNTKPEVTDANWDPATATTGGIVLTTDPTQGSYWVKATNNGKSIIFKVALVANSLQGTTAFHGTSIDDVKKTTFTYTGAAQTNINFALNGEMLESSTDYSAVNYYDAAGRQISSAPVNPGDYKAELIGAGDYLGSKVIVPLTVSPLDLSTADITATASAVGDSTAAITFALDGEDISSVVTYALPTNEVDNGSAGQYKITVTPAANQAGKVTGSKQMTVDRVAHSYTITGTGNGEWQYNAAAITGAGANPTVTINASDAAPNNAFDLSKLIVKAADADTDLGVAAGDNLDYTISVTDAKGNKVSNDSLAKPGLWTVTATIDAAKYKYFYGGSFKFDVQVYAGTVNSNDIVVTKDNAIFVDATAIPYDGTNALNKLKIVVKCGDKTLTAGTDYTVLLQKENASGAFEDIDAAVDAGNYEVTVESSTYNIASPSFTFSVSAIDVAHLRVADTSTDKDGSFVPYTGKAITPVIEYTTDATVTDDSVWKTLPAEAYTMTYEVVPEGSSATPAPIKEIKEKGQYTITLASTTEGVGVDYTLPATATAPLTVRDGVKVFQDVPSTAWYYESVNKAFANGYMTGYNGSALFGPNDNITRAQVACVLFKMAGAPEGAGQDSYDSQKGYITGFSDVDGHMWYAQAIAWAKNAKVISGYGDGTFGPNDMITRQQFATMLANYARAMGQSTTVEDVDAVLATKKDGGQVSGWAKDSVAWAVSKQIMGNGGAIAPKSDITRAEVAAMAVNFQPEEVESPTK